MPKSSRTKWIVAALLSPIASFCFLFLVSVLGGPLGPFLLAYEVRDALRVIAGGTTLEHRYEVAVESILTKKVGVCESLPTSIFFSIEDPRFRCRKAQSPGIQILSTCSSAESPMGCMYASGFSELLDTRALPPDRSAKPAYCNSLDQRFGKSAELVVQLCGARIGMDAAREGVVQSEFGDIKVAKPSGCEALKNDTARQFCIAESTLHTTECEGLNDTQARRICYYEASLHSQSSQEVERLCALVVETIDGKTTADCMNRAPRLPNSLFPYDEEELDRILLPFRK